MYHKPVMLSECIDALNINPNGIYVDVTFGGGGHSINTFAEHDGLMIRGAHLSFTH